MAGPATARGGNMLQNIRDRSQGWIAKVIIGFIILLMALTGFEAIIRATGHQGAVALVNGDEIKQTELAQAVEMQRRQLQQQLGQGFDPSTLDDRLLRESALKALIDKQLLLQRPQGKAARSPPWRHPYRDHSGRKRPGSAGHSGQHQGRLADQASQMD